MKKKFEPQNLETVKFEKRTGPSVEMKICGVNACNAAYEKRSSDIVRAYVTEKRLKLFSNLLKYCAKNKRAYRIVTEEELGKITESTHHEGVCLLVKRTPLQSEADFLNKQKKSTKKSCIVALENVENPHNIGAILRVCANFGADALLVSNTKQAQSTAAYRTAEGGAEWVSVLETENLLNSISSFKKAGYKIIGTSSHVANSLYKEIFPNKVLLLLGSETEGLSSDILRACDSRVCIHSTGHVESLNVACATGILLNEFYRNQT
jgi:TrmH RNA methyltransferase